jgi:hypothetical protein
MVERSTEKEVKTFVDILIFENDKLVHELCALRSQNQVLKKELGESNKHKLILMKETKTLRKELVEYMKKAK